VLAPLQTSPLIKTGFGLVLPLHPWPVGALLIGQALFSLLDLNSPFGTVLR
jgi:hypothetical protein